MGAAAGGGLAGGGGGGRVAGGRGRLRVGSGPGGEAERGHGYQPSVAIGLSTISWRLRSRKLGLHWQGNLGQTESSLRKAFVQELLSMVMLVGPQQKSKNMLNQ